MGIKIKDPVTAIIARIDPNQLVHPHWNEWCFAECSAESRDYRCVRVHGHTGDHISGQGLYYADVSAVILSVGTW